MAKLLSYYRLCPLIDTKNLLGISEDVEKGTVIVTLGKNIAIKYRLSDQKQLCSWRSKEKFSSPVYYDGKLEKYVAVFNQTFIRIWTEEEETLDKVKKYKFNQRIHTILIHNKEVYVVFKTGSLYPLNEILESRKTFIAATVIEGLEIYDFLYTSLDEDLYFGILVKQDDVFMFHWTIHTYYSKNNVFSKNSLHIEDMNLKSYTLFASNKKVDLVTVWNDGRMFALELVRHDSEQSDVGELFTVLENVISTNHLIKVVPLDYKHIAIYGSDPNEEGAVLLIYNTQFKVTQSKQIHKLYTEEANIWRTYNFILLPVGQNLIVVPFCLESEKLSTLIASHKLVQAKTDTDVVFLSGFEIANWSSADGQGIISKKTKEKKNKKGKTESKKVINNDLKNRFDELLSQGLPEAAIVEQLIAEVLDENDLNLLEDILSFFSDIPEKILAKIIHFTLSCDSSNFAQCSEIPYKNLPEKLLPTGRTTLLDKILVRHFSDTLLLPYLRTELSVDEATNLLQYFVYQLSEDGHNMPSFNALRTERCIINWTSIIIDSNYQKFILSKDSEIEGVLVKCKNAVAEYFDVLEDLKAVVPVLAKVDAEAKGRSFVRSRVANGSYSIEQIYY